MQIILLLSLNNCQAQNNIRTATVNKNISQNDIWQTQLQNLNKSREQKYRIIQFGDSHTASDFFTGELRKKLQAYYGDGGIGWIYPSKLRGQRLSDIKYTVSGWETLSSRTDKNDFPMGGIIARAIQPNNSITIASTTNTNELYKITALVKPIEPNSSLTFSDNKGVIPIDKTNINSSSWQNLNFYAQLPLSYSVGDNEGWDIGAINIENTHNGIILSALGINGAQLNQWSRWNPIYHTQLKNTNADLIIIAYGTNESIDRDLKLADTKKLWLTTIQNIKQDLPHATILIIGAPESLKSTAGYCGIRTDKLNEVQNMQREIAEEQGILYWSWEDAMGGSCSMKKLIAQGLARKDGVHFTEKGYELFADKLAEKIIQSANN